MATQLFRVKVLENAGNTAIFRLQIISGEQPDFYASKSFALMLLYDPIVSERVTDAPLAEHVTFDDTLDAAWVNAHGDDYIRSTRLFDVKNHPRTVDLSALSAKQQREFWKSNRAPQASLEVVVTDPRWLAHLKAGDQWETAAYDATL